MTGDATNACPFCGEPATANHNSLDSCQYGCRSCGRFIVTREAEPLVDLASGEERIRLSWFSRSLTLRNRIAFFTSKPGVTPSGLSERLVPISIEEVLQDASPRLLSDRFDRALLNLSRSSKHLGESISLEWRTDWPLVYGTNDDEMRFVLGALEELGFIRTACDSSSGILVALTAQGWQRAVDLATGLVVAKPRQGFVAMWFGNKKDLFQGRPSCDFCSDVYLKGLKPAIEAAGYEAMRIDFKEYIDDVKDEILAEIRRSQFIVADFTGHRPGVYFEAGFAMGLGIPVFFTCHEQDIPKAHFDTNHYNHIAWSSFEDLAIKLKNRVLAVLGAATQGAA